jgi:gamma-glutamyltranspeptidase/glutathione hydrolase/leukotriene-C4 hydrolase
MSSYSEPLASQGAIYYHRLAEAFKHVFAIRMSLGDPSFVNTSNALDSLLSENYMKNLQLNTSDFSVLPLNQYGGLYNAQFSTKVDHGTTHIRYIILYDT